MFFFGGFVIRNQLIKKNIDYPKMKKKNYSSLVILYVCKSEEKKMKVICIIQKPLLISSFNNSSHTKTNGQITWALAKYE